MPAFSNAPHVRISAPDGIGQSASVEINGKKVICLTSVKLDLDPASWAAVELGLLVSTIEFDGLANVAVNDETAALLVDLGWTPPTDA